MLVTLAAAASLAAGGCGDDVEQGVNEGARETEKTGRDAGKAAEHAARGADEKGAEDAAGGLEK